MKRKTVLLLLLACALLLLTACGSNDQASPQKNSEQASTQKTSEIPVVLNQPEYVLYQNVFYNNYMDDYVGKETAKEGIYAVVQDAFSSVTRYYVWGYLDQTQCCDWQWEFVPEAPDKLPPPGSKIKVSGTYEKADSALDDRVYRGTGGTEHADHERYSGTGSAVQYGQQAGTVHRKGIHGLRKNRARFHAAGSLL